MSFLIIMKNNREVILENLLIAVITSMGLASAVAYDIGIRLGLTYFDIYQLVHQSIICIFIACIIAHRALKQTPLNNEKTNNKNSR